MSTKAQEPRFAVPARGFRDKLSKFMADNYDTLMESASHGRNPGVVELLDSVLSFLPLPVDEVMGFVASQLDTLANAANEVCENWPTKIPSHRVLICDRRYVRIDTLPVYYDVSTNKVEPTGPKFMPIESVVYSIGAVYARIIQQRKAEEAGKSSSR